MNLSVIIPTFNEEKALTATLASLRLKAGIELLVVDGGSTDRTCEVAQDAGALVLHNEKGRAKQMNRGGSTATGDILLFLHADSQPPANYPKLISQCLAMPDFCAGAFSLGIDLDGPAIRCIETMATIRSRLLQRPYGDQGLFLHRSLFHQLGGFPDVSFLEDLLFVKKLRQSGKIITLPEKVITSGRRWQQRGIIRTTLLNQCILLGHFLGVSPKRLAGFYHRL